MFRPCWLNFFSRNVFMLLFELVEMLICESILAMLCRLEIKPRPSNGYHSITSRIPMSFSYLVVVYTTVALVTQHSAPSCLSADSLKGRDLSHEDEVVLKLWLSRPFFFLISLPTMKQSTRQSISAVKFFLFYSGVVADCAVFVYLFTLLSFY